MDDRSPAVAILEDNPKRVEPMRIVLKSILPTCELRFFPNAPDMIRWLEWHLARVVLISLDHDLDSVVPREQQPFDPGCGRDVADWLADRPAICPVFVHTSNYDAGVGMMWVLERAQWPTHRAYPHDHMDWISTDWAGDVRAFLRDGWIQLWG